MSASGYRWGDAQALIEAKVSGLLDIRNFVDYFAEYFEISRATVYNYLKAIAVDDGNG